MPKLNVSKIKSYDLIDKNFNTDSLSNFFAGLNFEVFLPLIDTSKVTDMNMMFNGCYSLKYIGKFNTSNVTNMSYMFQSCSKITSVPLFDTSKVTNMSGMFNACNALVCVPLFDTSKVTNMSSMFTQCKKITSVPLFDTSKVTAMNNMFEGCTELTSIPQLDTSNVTTMYYMFNGCTSLVSVSLLDCGKIASGSNMNIFGTSSTQLSKLNHLGGFKDLGKVSGFNKPSVFLRYCPNLTKESVLNIISNLYDRNTAGYSVVTLPFHANALALLSDEEKAIATNKGWTLATS